MFDDCNPAMLIVESALAPVAAQALALASTPGVAGGLVFGGPDPGVPDSFADYEETLAAAPGTSVEIAVDERAPVFIMYTSGTTGRPKGAVLTHYNLLVQTISRIAHLGLPTDCRVFLAGTPLFHIAGLSALLASFLVGGRVVVGKSGAFDPVATVDLLARERISSCFFVPAQWQAICVVPDLAERDLSALPLLNVEVRIVDADMNDVAAGEVGEIVYRGPSVMSGYSNKPEENEAAFSGGWFHSGDLVREDEDGYLYVVDRLEDMIISGGENVYCAEVEDAIAGHPKVAEVAVVGVPDERWGEVPHAIVVPVSEADPPSADEIERWSRRHLAAYKCPRRLTVLAELPRNASGKVRKTELRARLAPVAC